MDLSKYTLPELQTLRALRAKPMANLTDDELQTYRGLVAKGQGDAATAPGSLKNPAEADIFGSDVDRAGASFGDLAGVSPTLLKAGWKNPQKNPSGDTVVQGPNGKYYKDATSFFGGHPLNWAESHLGQALPTAGMMVGGAAGEGLASIPLAGAGASAGEAARIGLGKLLGTYQGGAKDAAADVALEGAGGAAAEIGGKVIGKVPIPYTGLNVSQATKKGLQALLNPVAKMGSKISQTLTGVDGDAFMRQFERPQQVATANRPGNALRVAQNAEAERDARATTENSLISRARQAFQQKYGREPMNTQEFQSFAQDALNRNLPNSSGHSGMTPSELQELQDLVGNDFSTTRVVSPEVRASRVGFEDTASPILDASGRPITTPRSIAGPEFTVQPEQTEQVPVKAAGELQKTADYLQEQVPQGHYDKLVNNTRSGKSISAYQGLLARLKQAMHGISPELESADSRFSNYMDNTKLLGPIDSAARGESFIDNLFGKNKTAVQQAAKEIIPHTYEEAADIAARKELSRGHLADHPVASRLLDIGSPIAGAGVGYSTTHTPEGALIGATLGTLADMARSPTLHRWGYSLGGRMVQNPQLVPALLDTAGRSPWSLLKGSLNGQEKSPSR